MKAVYFTQHGGVEVLTYGDRPEPAIGPNDVKIRVRACGINRVDVFTRMGVRGTRLDLAEPHILGGDVAGDVAEAGPEVTRVKPGDRVVANPRQKCGQCQSCISGDEELCAAARMLGTTTSGGYAEYVAVPSVDTVVLPDSVSYEEAASLPTVFMPCWNMLLRRAELKHWETALVLSASGGVGTAAVQVAKHVVGARVIATTSSRDKAGKVGGLGADEVVVYTEEDVKDRVLELTGGRGVDVVVDHVGADFWPDAYASLSQGGRYGICGVTSGYRAELQMGLLFMRQQTVFGVYMGRTEDLRQIVQMVERGTLHAVIHETFPLEEAAEAHSTMEAREFFGKLVLTMP